MKLEDLLADNINKWKAMVTELGGQWVGVQQGFQDVEPFVLFVAPSSMSPIGVPVSQMTLDNVKQKMGIKTTPNVSKKPQSVDFTRLILDLHNIADQLTGLVVRIQEELKDAEKRIHN